ncbi:MAG: tryptophan transporter [Clostridium sp.]
MNTNLNTKRMTTNAILIAIGAILHQITPAIPLFGISMQPDLSLVMLFIIMLYNKEYKTSLICGIAVGVFAALTTKMPMGQIPNIVDKFITTNIMFVFISLIRNKLNVNKLMMIVLPIGTLISGTLFISVAAIIGGIEVSAFAELFVSVVLTTAVINTLVGFGLFKIVERTAGATGAYFISE